MNSTMTKVQRSTALAVVGYVVAFSTIFAGGLLVAVAGGSSGGTLWVLIASAVLTFAASAVLLARTQWLFLEVHGSASGDRRTLLVKALAAGIMAGLALFEPIPLPWLQSTLAFLAGSAATSFVIRAWWIDSRARPRSQAPDAPQ